MSKAMASFLKWIKGPIALASGWVGTWVYTNIPGLHVFGVSASSTGKWLSGALVFATSTLAGWVAHDQAVNHLLATVEKDVEKLGVGSVVKSIFSRSVHITNGPINTDKPAT